MKSCISLLFFSVLFSTAFAQKEVDRTVEEKAQVLKDVIEQRLRKEQPNQMPNAVKIVPVKPIYKGNNSMGYDVYESQLDNMPILMPDSNYKVIMPIAAMQPTLPFVPLQQSKTPDFLYKKPWEPKLNFLPKKKKY